MFKVSVLTPTIRKEALGIVKHCLDFQIFKDFEWLIGSPFDPEIKEARWIVDDFKGGFWTFNRISTKLCKEARGEVIVFWQDSIWANPQALEKFYINVKATDGAISGTGDQYDKLDEYGKPYHKVWEDPRRSGIAKFGYFYECEPNDWEINFAAIEKENLEKVNYFVDRADFEGYGADNVMLADKLDLIGVRFYLDHENQSFTLRHERERKDWDSHYIMNTDFFKKRKYLS